MDLQVLTAKQAKHAHTAKAILDLAEKETRALTADEEKAHEAEVKALEGLGTQIAKFKHDDEFKEKFGELFGNGQDGGRVIVTRGHEAKSLGQQFIESAAGKYLLETKGTRSGQWRTPSVELKATLTEAGLIVPQYLPTPVPSATPPIVMSQLFAQGPTSSNAIVYLEETLFTNAAAAVAEGAVKPESTLTFAQKTSKVEKLAHWLPVTDELLEDEPAMAAYIDSRLRLGVLLELDDELLNGTGVSPELLGLLVRNDLTAPLAMGSATGPDAIAAQIAAVEQASQLPVDGIVLNPSDWLKMRLLKTTQGEYLGGSPFDPAQPATLWGRAVAQTVKMPAGTALVGAFKTGGGQLFNRGGLRVDASNAHSDFFVRNLVAIRAEIRVALALFRPKAFGKVTAITVP